MEVKHKMNGAIEMMEYKKTYKVLEVFYDDCIKFWTDQGKDELNAHLMAMRDIENITTNPFSPCGEELDLEAKAEFIGHLA